LGETPKPPESPARGPCHQYFEQFLNFRPVRPCRVGGAAGAIAAGGEGRAVRIKIPRVARIQIAFTSALGNSARMRLNMPICRQGRLTSQTRPSRVRSSTTRVTVEEGVVTVFDTLAVFLADDLERIHGRLDAVLEVEGRLMREVSTYALRTRGKMLRPAIACLAARAQEREHDAGHRVAIAACVELIHTATLLHDDVIDKAPLRRGRQTVNAKWGDDVAILLADYFYASAFELAIATLRPEVLRVIIRVTKDMALGEMFQIETRDRWLHSEEYLQIIRQKTAQLFGACAGLGALVGGAAPEVVKRFSDFGCDFGMAFQLTDDALDYSAQGERWGKRVGSDVAEGKQTMPLLHTLQQANDSDRQALLACLNDGRDFGTVHHYVSKYGGIEATRDLARQYTGKALKSLEGMAASESVALLQQAARYTADREY